MKIAPMSGMARRRRVIQTAVRASVMQQPHGFEQPADMAGVMNSALSRTDSLRSRQLDLDVSITLPGAG